MPLTYSSKPDIECIRRGSLRGFLCDKMVSPLHRAGRPFTFYKAYDRSGNELDTIFTDNQVWSATSILFDPLLTTQISQSNELIYTQQFPEEIETVDEYLKKAREEFHETCGYTDYDPMKMNTILRNAVENEKKRLGVTASEIEIESGIEREVIEYLNNKMAKLPYQTDSPYLVKHKDKVNGRVEYRITPFKSIKQSFSNGASYSTYVGKKLAKFNAFDILSNSVAALTYSDIDFCEPEKRHTECFNLWRGFNYTKETCARYKDYEFKGRTNQVFNVQTINDHIHSFICGGDGISTTYLLKWMAHILQKPFVKTASTPIMVSHEGIGKDLIFTKIMGLLYINI